MRRVGILAVLIVVAAVSIGGYASARPGIGSPVSRFEHAESAVAPYEVLDFTAVSGHTAWAVTAGNELRDPPQSVQRSIDGGARWSDLTPSPLARAGRSRNISSTDFLSPSRAWVAYGPIEPGRTRPTLLSTSDGGRIWTRAGRLPSSGCELQFVNPSDGWCVTIGAALGSELVAIYRTTTAGRTWREVSHNAIPGQRTSRDPIPFGCDKSVAFTSSVNGFAASYCAGGEGYIYATADGGARWRRQLSLPMPAGGSDGAGFTSVVARGDAAAAGYTAAGYRSTPTSSSVYHSLDGGARWTKVDPPGRPRAYDVDIVTPSVWRLVAGRTVLATDNAGRSWTHITANVTLHVGSVRFFTTTVGWDLPLNGNSDNVLHTTDGGRHWTTHHVPQITSPNGSPHARGHQADT